jgi:DNA repair protein RadC
MKNDALLPDGPAMEEKKHYHGHRGRLMQKFLTRGLESFHDYEVLELLLTFSIPRRDCKVLAKALLENFGSFSGVFDAPGQELEKTSGIGPRCAALIKCVRAVAERYCSHGLLQKDFLRSSAEVVRYLDISLRGQPYEIFKIIFLNHRLEILGEEELARGTIDQSAVYPRNVFAAALQRQASGLVLAHNHPDGPPAPSEEDVRLTRHLYMAGRLLGILVHEHIIIGRDSHFSFRDAGLMSQFDEAFRSIQNAPLRSSNRVP